MRLPFPFMNSESTEKGAGQQPDEKSGPKPIISYWHLWTDESGISHQKQCSLVQFELKGVGGADPQWNNNQGNNPSTVVFTVTPPPTCPRS